MRKLFGLVYLLFLVFEVSGQSFEIGTLQDVYKGAIGETVRVPIRLINTSEKAITLIVRRANSTLGGTQKNYFCPENNCLDQKVEDVVLRLEPHETVTNFTIALEAGLANGISSAKYLVINKFSPGETIEFDLHFAVEEHTGKEDIYLSPHIVLHDVYPNPVTDYAVVNYSITNEAVAAKIIIHNILGNPVDEYVLPSSEHMVKIRAEPMNAGIYFYTLYLDNEGVITRKLIVRK
jgi:hypothetical protein